MTRGDFDRDSIHEESPVDLWEQRCKQHVVKKKKFTVLSDCEGRLSDVQYVDYKDAISSFEDITGNNGPLSSTSQHFAQLSNGDIVQIIRVKVLTFPGLFGGNKLCFLGKVFVLPNSVDLSHNTSQRFTTSEILETNYYTVILENHVVKDVSVHFPNFLSPTVARRHSKNAFVCRYHYYPETQSTGPVLEDY